MLVCEVQFGIKSLSLAELHSADFRSRVPRSNRLPTLRHFVLDDRWAQSETNSRSDSAIEMKMKSAICMLMVLGAVSGVTCPPPIPGSEDCKEAYCCRKFVRDEGKATGEGSDCKSPVGRQANSSDYLSKAFFWISPKSKSVQSAHISHYAVYTVRTISR